MSARLWRLKLSSLWVRVNWSHELQEAYLAGDWFAYRYCLRRDPSLWQQKVAGVHLPLHLLIQSGDLEGVKEALSAGVNAEQISIELELPHRWQPVDLEPQRELQKTSFLSNSLSNKYSTDSLRFDALTVAWAQSQREIYEELFSRASAASRYRSFTIALQLADEEWLATFDWNRCIAGVQEDFEPSQHQRGDGEAKEEWMFQDRFLHSISPPIAALFGENSITVFEKVWLVCPEKLRRDYHVESPGYGHDNDPVYGGDVSYWAELMGREDVLGFLKRETASQK